MTSLGLSATLSGTEGKIVRVADTRMNLGLRNVWWQARGTEESRMFSLRADGTWREFPGRADGPGLVFTR